MMEKMKLLMVVVLAGMVIMGLSTAVMADNSQEVEMDAEIIENLTLEEGNPAGLNFGQFTSPAEEVTLYLNPEDYNDEGGSEIAGEDIAWAGTEDDDFVHFGGAHAANFTVDSPTDVDNYDVVLSNLPSTIDGASGAASENSATMDVDEWAVYDQEGNTLTEDATEAAGLVLDENDEGAFSVGAKLTASAGQDVGTYEGTFDVQVNYQ